MNNFSLVSNRKLNSARGAEYKKLVESNNTSSNDEEEEHSLSDEDCKHMPGYIKATWYKSPNPKRRLGEDPSVRFVLLRYRRIARILQRSRVENLKKTDKI